MLSEQDKAFQRSKGQRIAAVSPLHSCLLQHAACPPAWMLPWLSASKLTLAGPSPGFLLFPFLFFLFCVCVCCLFLPPWRLWLGGDRCHVFMQDEAHLSPFILAMISNAYAIVHEARVPPADGSADNFIVQVGQHGSCPAPCTTRNVSLHQA